jgi:hypothetical protein
LLKKIRLIHYYLGTLFAPCILFFAFSGALQIFTLHEANNKTGYRPPEWVLKMADVHKRQSHVDAPAPKAVAVSVPASRVPTQPPGPPELTKNSPLLKGSIALKWFFFVMAMSLIVTTLLGVWMSFKYNRDSRVIWGLLIAGTVLPIALLWM